MKNTEKKNVEFVNLTPHEVVIYDQNNNVILRIPPSGQVARVSQSEELVGYINGIPIYSLKYSDIQGLPEPQENTVYIVSQLVLQALKALKEKGIARARDDVIAPNTGPTENGAVRDSQGRIVGVRSFITL
jgi:hypothetical protein